MNQVRRGGILEDIAGGTGPQRFLEFALASIFGRATDSFCRRHCETFASFPLGHGIARCGRDGCRSDDVQLARMEDPLPDGPWDLVVSVLSVHHVTNEQKQDLFRRVREQSRSLVMGDVVIAEPQVAPLEEGVDFPARAEDLVEWCGGEIAWRADDLAVIRAVYD